MSFESSEVRESCLAVSFHFSNQFLNDGVKSYFVKFLEYGFFLNSLIWPGVRSSIASNFHPIPQQRSQKRKPL